MPSIGSAIGPVEVSTPEDWYRGSDSSTSICREWPRVSQYVKLPVLDICCVIDFPGTLTPSFNRRARMNQGSLGM